jgi:hypothetical protein
LTSNPPDTPTGRQSQVYTSRIASFSQPHSNPATKLPIRPRALPNTTKPLGTYFRRVLFPAHHALANCITPCIASEDSHFAIAQQAKCCSTLALARRLKTGTRNLARQLSAACSCPLRGVLHRCIAQTRTLTRSAGPGDFRPEQWTTSQISTKHYSSRHDPGLTLLTLVPPCKERERVQQVQQRPRQHVRLTAAKTIRIGE